MSKKIVIDADFIELKVLELDEVADKAVKMTDRRQAKERAAYLRELLKQAGR